MARTSTITTWQRILVAFVILVGAASATTTPTTTTLSVSSSDVSAGTMVTLTASVAAGATPVTAGLVNFCNASAPHCEDAAVFGSVWMTKAGTATLRKPFGPGSQNIQAIFKGTNAYAASTSATSIITVTGLLPVATTSTISSAGAAGNYTLTGTVMAPPGTPGPTGTVSFLDTTNENYAVQSATLGSPTFGVSAPASTQILPSGDRDYVPIAGDFNNDGILDLAIVDYAKDNIYIYLGNGNGTFTLKSTIAVANAAACPQVIATADLNGDGNLDFVVANDSNEVYVFLGNGDGTFTLKSSPATGSVPSSVAIADFNGDGIPDLAVTNYTSQTVSILLGNGDGTFTLKSSPAVGSEPYVGIVAADFNGDGITDLAVPNYNGNSVSILLGNGDGTFAAGTTISTGGTYLYPQYIFTGDFNGDGKPDLAVLAVTNTGVPGLEIFLGNGNATFNLTSTITGPAAMAAPSIGDFNGDGVVDFAVEVGATGNLAPWSLRYYLGNGDGTFSLSPNTVSMSARANKSVAGDFDGDGYSDVVFMTWPASFPDTITTYLQRQSAAATVTGVAVPGPGSHNVLASYGGDGFNSASQSSTVALTGSQIASTAILSVAPGTTFTLGNPASVATGTISPYPVGKYAFTGSEMATLYDGATAIGSAYPNASGQFVFAGTPGPLSDLAVGSHSLTFTFPGDANYKSSTSAAVPVTVTPGIPTMTCSPTPASYVYGSGFVNIQVTLQGFPNQSIPGYNENFSMYIDGGTTPIVTESGWWNTSTSSAVNMEPNIPHWAGISAGTHTLTVKYPGDATWAAASCSSTITVAADPIGLSYPGHVTSSASPANSGSPVTFSEFGFYDTSWCGAQCTTVPTGTVTFYSDGAPIGAVSPNTSSFASTGYFSAALTISTLPPGTHAITATYSGDANYSSATTSTAFSQIVKTAPTITWATPASITYGTVLDGTELNATANTPGTFAYTPAAGTVPSAGTQTLSVTFTPTDTADYSSASATTTLTVTQAAPVITWGSPAGIVYGTALSGAQLNASGSVPGTFVYSPALGTVLQPGTQTLTAAFTPNDSVDYSVQVPTVTLTVSPITPSITWAIPAPISYGTPLSATQLDATSGGLAGTIVYTPAVGTVLTAGSQILSAAFTPTDTIHYSSRTVTVPLTVTQALPGVTWGSPAAITYGTALDSTELNATASVPGTFVYTPPAGTVLSAGSQVLSAVFSPTDSVNYTSQAASVVLTVNPAAPQIVWAMPATIPQGSALSSTQLNATTLNGIAGTYSYVPPAGTVLATPGSQKVTVTFIPTNSNYKPVSQTQTLNVQVAPVLTWNPPAAISYGKTIYGAQLDAISNVPGAFVYTPASGTLLPAGQQTLSVIFTPTDSTSYATATASVPLTVMQANPVLTWNSPAPIAYGTALWAQQLNASASVPGTFVYTPPAGTVLPVGLQTLTATFTPNDPANYVSGGTVTTTVSVGQATPVITWPSPVAVPVGTALGATQLDATANVAGTFVYSPAAGTVLSASGTQTLTVSFTSTDTVHYAPVSATATIAVTSTTATTAKTTPIITWAKPAAITNPTPLSSTQLNATASVPGTFTYSPAAGTVLPAGTQALVVTFTPTDTTHYNVAGGITTLTVNPSPTAVKVTWNQPEAINYGTALWGAQLNATSNVAGTFTYSPASGTVLAPGTQTLSVTFTPANTASAPQTTTVPLVVNQLVPVLKWNTPAAITSGSSLWAMQLNASASVPGTFVYSPAAATVLTTGTYTLSATFTPADAVHYSGGTVSTTLTVK